MGIRPENITFTTASEANVSGKVELVEYLGSDNFIYVKTSGDDQVLVRTNGQIDYKTGQSVHLSFDIEQTHFFK